MEWPTARRRAHPILGPGTATGHVTLAGEEAVVAEPKLRLVSSLSLKLEADVGTHGSQNGKEEDSWVNDFSRSTTARGETDEENERETGWTQQRTKQRTTKGNCEKDSDNESNSSLEEEYKSTFNTPKTSSECSNSETGSLKIGSSLLASGYDSGWVSEPFISTHLLAFLHATRHHITPSGQACIPSLNVVGIPLDSNNALVGASRDHLSPLEKLAGLPLHRQQFFGCGQAGHEVHWSAKDDSQSERREEPNTRTGCECGAPQTPDFVHNEKAAHGGRIGENNRGRYDAERHAGESPEALCIVLQSPSSYVHDVGLCARLDRSGSAMVAYFDRNEDRLDKTMASVSNDYFSRSEEDHDRYAPSTTDFPAHKHADSSRRTQLSGPAAFFHLLVALLHSYAEAADMWRILLTRQVRRMEGETAARAEYLEISGTNETFRFGRLMVTMQNAHVSHVTLEQVIIWLEDAWVFAGEMVHLAQQLWPEAKDCGRCGYRSVGSGSSGSALGMKLTRAEVDRLMRDISDAKRACRTRMSQIAAVQRRMQAQIGMLYSLIGQRDNRVNIELSRDMRETAAAAKKDSRVMKVIAALTLFFLPATMISSVFSTGIFNVGRVDDNNPRVSEFWWVFVLASVVSTAVVMILGYLFLKEDLVLKLPLPRQHDVETPFPLETGHSEASLDKAR